MAKSLLKVEKKISKSKKSLHPKGRKAQHLARASLREERVNKKKLIHTMRKSEENLIVDFFQEYVKAAKEEESFDLGTMKSLIESFIDRDHDELEQLRSSRRPGRPTTKKQDLLEFRLKQETHVYETGWKVPDLRDAENVQKLRAWGGGHGGLTSIKFILVKKHESETGDVEMS